MNFTGYLTSPGAELLAETMQGGSLFVTRVVAGAGTTAENAVTLAAPRQNVTISNRCADGSLATLQVTLAASLADEAYDLKELGIYAQAPEGKEILYLIYRLDQPIPIEPTSRLVLRAYLRLALSDDLSVSLSLPPSGLLVEEDLLAKADLVNGQVPYAQTPHLTGTVTLYVDAALGDDANPGTQQAPFRTIQAAIDSLPKDLGESLATIFVSPGQYDEDVLIQGFYRGGTSQTEIGLSYGLRLRGNGDDPPVVRSLRLVSNLIPAILVNDLNISGGMNGIGVFVQRCINVVILGCAISNCKTGISVGGYYTSGGTSAHIDGTTISNTSEFAVAANGQNHVYAESLGGTGNAVGFSASYGAHITTRSITMQATTEQQLYCGFIDEF